MKNLTLYRFFWCYYLMFCSVLLNKSFSQADTLSLRLYNFGENLSLRVDSEKIGGCDGTFKLIGSHTNLSIRATPSVQADGYTILTLDDVRQPDKYYGACKTNRVELSVSSKTPLSITPANREPILACQGSLQIHEEIQKSNSEAIILNEPKLALINEKNGVYFHALSNSLCTLNKQNNLVISNYELKHIPAGKYKGNVVYETADQTLKAPLTISIKHKWHLPMLIAVLGILLGYFFTLAQFLEEKEQLKLRISTLAKRINDSGLSPEDKDRLIKQLEQLLSDVQSHLGKDLSSFPPKIDEIESEFEKLRDNATAYRNGDSKQKEGSPISNKLVIYIAKVLLIILLALGVLQQLYAKDDTFGADFWTDYFALIIASVAVGAVADLTIKNLLIKMPKS